jgi:Transposase
MVHYVGLDVSLKQTSICVVDQAGSVVREGLVDPDPEAIAAFVRSKAPGALRIGLETGPTTTWLWTELKRLGLPVICIDARHAKAVLKMQINKSDRNDAAGLLSLQPSCCAAANRRLGPAIRRLSHRSNPHLIRSRHRQWRARSAEW